MVKNGENVHKFSKLVKNGQKWAEMANMAKIVKNGKKWSKIKKMVEIVKSSQKVVKNGQRSKTGQNW